MPWLPEFTSAVELARRELVRAERADPVAQYLAAVTRGESRDLESVWSGQVLVLDPRAGRVEGHRQLEAFARTSAEWLASRRARVESGAATAGPGRAVVELMVHLDGEDEGPGTGWPVAVVAESPEDRVVTFRIYCSQRPVDGRRHVRGAVLEPGGDAPGDVVGAYLAALRAGDVDAVVAAFTPDGYVQEAEGPHPRHDGTEALRELFGGWLADGGVTLDPCRVTDDGVRCAVEYNCVRWGSTDLPPQAELAVFERGPGGLLAAQRIYGDVVPPGAPT